jgi:hypothetical protein
MTFLTLVIPRNGENMLKHILVVILAILIPAFPSTKLLGEKIDLRIASYDCPEIATSFETAYVQDSSKFVIILDDGSQWIIRNNNPDKLYNQISNDWKSGDEIRIGCRKPEEYQGRYILKNVRNNAICFVDLDPVWMDQSKAFYIEKIDENGYAIFTKNGLEWAIGWWGAFTTRQWMKGDRIIINKSEYSGWEDYLLINVDKQTNVWGSLIVWK